MLELLVSIRGKMKTASSGLLAFPQSFVGKAFHWAWQVFWQPAFLPSLRRLKQRVIPPVTNRQREPTKTGRVMNIVAPPSRFGIYISHITQVSTTRPIR